MLKSFNPDTLVRSKSEACFLSSAFSITSPTPGLGAEGASPLGAFWGSY